MARTLTSVLQGPSRVSVIPHRRRLRPPRSMLVGSILTALVLLAAVVTSLAPLQDPMVHNIEERLQPPSRAHLLGTDQYGRELWLLILAGAPSAVLVGFGAVLLGGATGGFLGLVAGYRGGMLEETVMRFTDLLLAMPLLVLALAIVVFLGQSLLNVLVAVAIVNLPMFTRTSRAVTLQVSAQDFVLAARAMGATDRRILLRHVLPNILAPLIIVATLRVGSAILLEATLSFLGLGPGQNIVSWGQIIDGGRRFLLSAPWISMIAGAAISLTVLGLNLLGDGLRDLMDPRLKT